MFAKALPEREPLIELGRPHHAPGSACLSISPGKVVQKPRSDGERIVLFLVRAGSILRLPAIAKATVEKRSGAVAIPMHSASVRTSFASKFFVADFLMSEADSGPLSWGHLLALEHFESFERGSEGTGYFEKGRCIKRASGPLLERGPHGGCSGYSAKEQYLFTQWFVVRYPFQEVVDNADAYARGQVFRRGSVVLMMDKV
jgi:hypothetical protein